MASQHHFLRLFRKVFGVTPHRYIIRKRLDHAARLLLTGESGIMEIALLCGFESPSHFISVFRQNYAMTPEVYRRNMTGRP